MLRSSSILIACSLIDAKSSSNHYKSLMALPLQYLNAACLLPHQHLQRSRTSNGGDVSQKRWICGPVSITHQFCSTFDPKPCLVRYYHAVVASNYLGTFYTHHNSITFCLKSSISSLMLLPSSSHNIPSCNRCC